MGAALAGRPRETSSGEAGARARRAGDWRRVDVPVESRILGTPRSRVSPAVPLKVEVSEDAVPKEPPLPVTTDHIPVPTEGALAASVTVVKPQVAALIWSVPALDTVGEASTIIE